MPGLSHTCRRLGLWSPSPVLCSTTPVSSAGACHLTLHCGEGGGRPCQQEVCVVLSAKQLSCEVPCWCGIKASLVAVRHAVHKVRCHGFWPYPLVSGDPGGEFCPPLTPRRNPSAACRDPGLVSATDVTCPFWGFSGVRNGTASAPTFPFPSPGVDACTIPGLFWQSPAPSGPHQ